MGIYLVSIPQSGLQAFRPPPITVEPAPIIMFQSLNRAYKRSDALQTIRLTPGDDMFQSLNRAYKRSDEYNGRRVRLDTDGFNPSIGLTSVPTRQDGGGAGATHLVSIPQSGLQAFRRPCTKQERKIMRMFQSLNRAYKRSDFKNHHWIHSHWKGFNPSIGLTSVPTTSYSFLPAYERGFNPSIGLTSVPTIILVISGIGEYIVSIPQSGLQAFRQNVQLMQQVQQMCFNHSIGLTSVPTEDGPVTQHSTLRVSIPQSGLQAFRRHRSHPVPSGTWCFNPSIGLTSVPTCRLSSI